jgi:hypothetical protein
MDFAKIDQCKPILLELSLAEHLVKPLMSLYGAEWRERGYGHLASRLRLSGSIHRTVYIIRTFLVSRRSRNSPEDRLWVR